MGCDGTRGAANAEPRVEKRPGKAIAHADEEKWLAIVKGDAYAEVGGAPNQINGDERDDDPKSIQSRGRVEHGEETMGPSAGGGKDQNRDCERTSEGSGRSR